MLKNQTIIDKMSLEEKAAMMSGKDTWSTVGYEKYGIPSMFLSDGPHGLRKQAGTGDHLGLNASLPATCYPTAATVANSWNEQLGEELGQYLGTEAVALGVNVILGPGLNIKRSPLCGRNFEYFSEDPYLSGKMAAAYVRGIQSKGIAACPKHFAANSQELRRMSSDSILDERTFREIYTTGFEIAIKEGKSKSIMTAYNRINGVYANENAHLLKEILEDEWGFDGFVVSDWGGSNDHVLGVQNGSHLEMPSTGKLGTREIVAAVESGRLSEEVLNQRLDELLTIIFDTQIEESKQIAGKFDIEAHHAFARKVAEDSIVLLKNKNNILPLAKGTKVAVIGDFAETPRYQGAGSSLVNPTKVENTLEMFEESGLVLQAFEKGYERNKKTNAHLIEKAKVAVKKADVVLLYVGLDEISESEGMDRLHMKMSQNQIDLINAISEITENIVVVMSAGSVVEMPWHDKVGAIVHGYLGGQAGASAMLNILTGKCCPSGKLNETYPIKYEDTPAYAYYPSKERSSEYRESLYVGYRYYETARIPVLYPFGYGLSYTSFSYSNLKISKEGVTFTIQNTGSCDGAEVAQLYIGRPSDLIFRPVKELKGFAKVFLKAGESTQVSIKFDDKTFRYYNTHTNGWEIESGTYEVMVGTNVKDILLKDQIEIAGTNVRSPYIKESLANYFSGEITNIDDYQFETLLDVTIPDGNWNTDGLLDINDAICQMYYAKSLLARLVYKILTGIKNRSEAKGKPNLNILFIYNMPFRGLAKMTGGAITMDMAHAILEIVNGRGLIGFAHLIKATVKR